MFVVLKSGLATKLPGFGIAKKLCKVLSKNNVFKNQVASLTRAAYRDESEVPIIKPFPYHEKRYDTLNMIFDTNECRIHKHCKLIVVEGPVASGKDQFARELATEFDFLYLPQPTFDDLFITHWGFDVRTLDCKLPKDVQTWDIERFLHHPRDLNTASMQLYMYFLRQKTYMLGLAHMFCTGQGVVTVRSPWSDKAFSKAMYLSKYISKPAFKSIIDSYMASLRYYLRPHLIIYLDVPVDITLKNIQNHGKSFEKTSEVLNEKYLTDIENTLKRDVLERLNRYSLQLSYDWSQGGDLGVIIDDIESLNFDNYTDSEDKLSDWNFTWGQWKTYAREYANNRGILLNEMDIATTVPELIASGESMRIWDDVWSEVNDGKYAPGFNTLKGDKDVLWKSKEILCKDYVTPLIEKYNEKKSKLK